MVDSKIMGMSIGLEILTSKYKEINQREWHSEASEAWLKGE